MNECKSCNLRTNFCLVFDLNGLTPDKCVCANCLVKSMCEKPCLPRYRLYENLDIKNKHEYDDLLHKRLFKQIHGGKDG